MRLISTTLPQTGLVKTTPAFFLSSKRICPFFTCSPSETIIEGRIPTYSSPSNATRRIAGPSSITWAGAPAIGRSSPFLILIIRFAQVYQLNPKLQIHPENVATL